MFMNKLIEKKKKRYISKMESRKVKSLQNDFRLKFDVESPSALCPHLCKATCILQRD